MQLIPVPSNLITLACLWCQWVLLITTRTSLVSFRPSCLKSNSRKPRLHQSLLLQLMQSLPLQQALLKCSQGPLVVLRTRHPRPEVLWLLQPKALSKRSYQLRDQAPLILQWTPPFSSASSEKLCSLLRLLMLARSSISISCVATEWTVPATTAVPILLSY